MIEEKSKMENHKLPVLSGWLPSSMEDIEAEVRREVEEEYSDTATNSIDVLDELGINSEFLNVEADSTLEEVQLSDLVCSPRTGTAAPKLTPESRVIHEEHFGIVD